MLLLQTNPQITSLKLKECTGLGSTNLANLKSVSLDGMHAKVIIAFLKINPQLEV